MAERRPTAPLTSAAGPVGMGRVERELVLRARVLDGASPTQIAQLLAHERDVTFAPGQALFAAGDPPRRFYRLLDGEVEIDGTPGRLGAGAPVGVTDALLDRPCLHTARAVGTVRAVAIDARDYFEFLDENPDLALSLVGNIAGDVHGHLLALPSPERFLALPHAALATGDAADTLVERLPVVRHVRPFVRASVQAQVSLADDAAPRRLAGGEVLFHTGAAPDTVWMVARGSVAVDLPATDDRRPVRLVSGPGDLVEHYAALTPGPRRAVAIALTDALLLGLPREALHDRMEEHFDLVRSILAHLASEQERLLQARALVHRAP